jgi:hypothetical protein
MLYAQAITLVSRELSKNDYIFFFLIIFIYLVKFSSLFFLRLVSRVTVVTFRVECN